MYRCVRACVCVCIVISWIASLGNNKRDVFFLTLKKKEFYNIFPNFLFRSLIKYTCVACNSCKSGNKYDTLLIFVDFLNTAYLHFRNPNWILNTPVPCLRSGYSKIQGRGNYHPTGTARSHPKILSDFFLLLKSCPLIAENLNVRWAKNIYLIYDPSNY